MGRLAASKGEHDKCDDVIWLPCRAANFAKAKEEKAKLLQKLRADLPED